MSLPETGESDKAKSANSASAVTARPIRGCARWMNRPAMAIKIGLAGGRTRAASAYLKPNMKPDICQADQPGVMTEGRLLSPLPSVPKLSRTVHEALVISRVAIGRARPRQALRTSQIAVQSIETGAQSAGASCLGRASS